jgi:hypothetical protein
MMAPCGCQSAVVDRDADTYDWLSLKSAANEDEGDGLARALRQLMVASTASASEFAFSTFTTFALGRGVRKGGRSQKERGKSLHCEDLYGNRLRMLRNGSGNKRLDTAFMRYSFYGFYASGIFQPRHRHAVHDLR